MCFRFLLKCYLSLCCFFFDGITAHLTLLKHVELAVKRNSHGPSSAQVLETMAVTSVVAFYPIFLRLFLCNWFPPPLAIKVIHAYYKANKLLKILEESIDQWTKIKMRSAIILSTREKIFQCSLFPPTSVFICRLSFSIIKRI